MKLFGRLSANFGNSRLETKKRFLQVFVDEFIGSLEDKPSCFEETRYGRAGSVERGNIRRSFVDKVYISFPLGSWARIFSSDEQFLGNLCELISAIGSGVRYSTSVPHGRTCDAIHSVLCDSVEESSLDDVYKRIQSLYK